MLPPLRLFASEMHSAAVPEAPRIYVPPESLYVKRLALLFPSEMNCAAVLCWDKQTCLNNVSFATKPFP
jgi:hypothetical protein